MLRWIKITAKLRCEYESSFTLNAARMYSNVPSADVVNMLYEMLLLIRDTRRLCLIAISVCVCLCACALRVLPVLFRVYPPTVQIGPLNVDIRGVNI